MNPETKLETVIEELRDSSTDVKLYTLWEADGYIQLKNDPEIDIRVISKSESITVIEKSLKKAGANHLLIPMEIGNKMSRIVVWWF